MITKTESIISEDDDIIEFHSSSRGIYTIKENEQYVILNEIEALKLVEFIQLTKTKP